MNAREFVNIKRPVAFGRFTTEGWGTGGIYFKDYETPVENNNPKVDYLGLVYGEGIGENSSCEVYNEDAINEIIKVYNKYVEDPELFDQVHELVKRGQGENIRQVLHSL